MNRNVLVGLLIAALAAAVVLGYVVGRWGVGGPPVAPAEGDHELGAADQVYTCSMHPQVRLDGPGMCPICEMPLIPASAATTGEGGQPMLQLSEHALAMASVETTEVSVRELKAELRAVGKVEYNESSLATVTARVDGYAERLFVNFTGVEIKAGDHLAEVYSPDILVAQQELLIALQSGAPGTLADTAKLKLTRWGLTDEQVEALVEEQRIADRVTLYSPISGTVIEKSIVQNSSFRAGDALYRVANLDTVWVYLDIYEYDLPWIRYGQLVEIVAEARPGRTFAGMVTFVEPIVNEQSRTVRVPVHVENPDHVLKPGMFVSATIRATLGRDGRAAPTGIEGKYSCPMHPQVILDESGPCPICEMPLEQIPGEPPPTAPTAATADDDDASHAGHSDAMDDDEPPPTRYFCPMKCEGEKTYAEPGRCPVCEMKLKPVPAATPSSATGVLAMPASAVLDSGTRLIVYVEMARGLFEPRTVVLGPRTGGFFPVLEGIEEGERVVTRGGFLIDSQFQITGHPSLFYPGGLMAGSTDHQHGQSPAPGSDSAPAAPADGHKH